MNLMQRLRDWATGPTTRETTDEIPSPEPAMPYTDVQMTEAATLRRNLAHATQLLTAARQRWSRLEARTDPQAHRDRSVLAEEILDAEAEVQRLTTALAVVDVAIAQTAALAHDYAALTEATEAWLAPLLAAMPSEDVLRRSYATSREIDRLAAALLAATQDRQFRRPLVDPFAALHDALGAALAVLDRQKLLRRVATRSDSKTA
jgi:hypothetical protein